MSDSYNPMDYRPPDLCESDFPGKKSVANFITLILRLSDLSETLLLEGRKK